MTLQMDAPSIALLDLIEPDRWQRIQDHFATVLGVPVRTVNAAHELLVTPSWPGGFEADRAISALKIGEELAQLLPADQPVAASASTTTRFGATFAVMPIRVSTDHVPAYFVLGPMVVGARESEVQFAERMAALGLDAHALWPIVLSLKLYSFAAIRSILHMMEDIGSTVAQLALQSRNLASYLPSLGRVEQAVAAYHTDKILESLLETATFATKADGGSIMLYDERRERLQIRAAAGLPPAIIEQPAPKDQGIAGVAAHQREVLLLDDQTGGELKGRMQRPDLVSSLVAPLIPGGAREPIGVLNLRTSREDRRFTAEHVELLRRMMALANQALGGVSAVIQQHQQHPPAPAH